MARVTVEDCVKIVGNRFELVALASQRARDISSGAVLTVDRDNDKNPVIALREIAHEKINKDVLKEELVRNLQKRGKFDVIESENTDSAEMDDLGIIEEMKGFQIVDDLSDDGSDISFDEENLDLND